MESWIKQPEMKRALMTLKTQHKCYFPDELLQQHLVLYPDVFRVDLKSLITLRLVAIL